MNHAEVLEEIKKDGRRKELRKEIAEKTAELEELGESPLDGFTEDAKELIIENALRRKKTTETQEMINKIGNFLGGD